MIQEEFEKFMGTVHPEVPAGSEPYKALRLAFIGGALVAALNPFSALVDLARFERDELAAMPKGEN